MQHFHFTFKRRRFDELKGIVEICVNSDQSGFIDSGSRRLRNSGKGGQGNGGNARSIAGNSGKGLWNSAD